MEKSDFLKRQEEAVKELYSMHENSLPVPPFVKMGNNANKQQPQKPQKSNLVLKDLFKFLNADNLALDSDRMLLLLLILLLSGESSDQTLILALAYIML